MIDKIRAYIDHAFKDTTDTKKIRELKEELLSNLIEKYNDQLLQGKSEAEAYNNAVSGIGDISELIDSVRASSPLTPPSRQELRNYALMVSVAVAMYILSAFTIPLFTILFNAPMIGIMVFFLIIAFATGMIIYANMMKPKYTKSEDSVVEEFKEWSNKTNRQASAWKSFSSGYWSLVVALYLAVSFIYGIWGFSWIIFIIAGAIENIIKGFVQLGSDRDE